MNDLPGKLDNVEWQGILEAAINCRQRKTSRKRGRKKQTKRTNQFFSETNIDVPENRNQKKLLILPCS